MREAGAHPPSLRSATAEWIWSPLNNKITRLRPTIQKDVIYVI